ncbi:MAG TPA: hypothetical protein VK427_06220 [Kofleriaceae bacterium]|nr:hypothetical protein [Kofleriaceae bacterium]
MKLALGSLLVPLLGAVLLPACLAVPDETPAMCEATEDCESGEICDDGVCWGNPPQGDFAAIISPPAERTTLISRELASVTISPDGWIERVQLEKPITYTAQLVCQAPLACDASMLAATITVSRPSSFLGGPGFRSVVKTKNGTPFTISVPPAHDAYTSYTVTVVPEGREATAINQTTPAQLLPPLRTQLTIDASASGKVLELGGIALPRVSGVIKNDSGEPQANYRVVAIGRWDYNSTPTEVSTVDFTGVDGTFSIQLSSGLTRDVELVARPLVTTTRPTLRHAGDFGQTGVANLDLAWPTGVGNKLDLDIPVNAVDGNGEVKPARGARVIVSARTAAPNGEATYIAEATTDDRGRARLAVLDGPAFVAAGYRISIVPQANSTAGVMYDQPLSILLPITEKRLRTRFALRGVVRLRGEGVKDMSVTARPSLRFVWSLDPEDQTFVTAIPPSTTVTPESGEFVLWVDPNLADTWGHYDLTLEAASGSMAPNTTIASIEVPRVSSQTTVTLGIFDLPEPAYVRGSIVDDKGDAVEGAELKLFRTEDFSSLCREVAHAPANCAAVALAASLLGRGASNANGEVRLTLPRMRLDPSE